MNENPNNPEPTLRDIFAGMAMMGDWSAEDSSSAIGQSNSYAKAARIYYAMADAMMEVRDE